jgi:hypothetical protein
LPRVKPKLFIQVLALVCFFGLITALIPPEHSPWRALKVEHPIGLATHLKLRSLAANPVQCRELLREAGIKLSNAQPLQERSGCSMNDVIRIEDGMGPYLPIIRPFMTCPMVVGQLLWERQIIAPAAKRFLAAELKAVEHLGTYNCRRQYGKETGPISQHAHANAFDISGFLVTNRRINIETDWATGGAESDFLKAVHSGACKIFSVALGPNHNAAHKNHFHFDMGSGSVCE